MGDEIIGNDGSLRMTSLAVLREDVVSLEPSVWLKYLLSQTLGSSSSSQTLLLPRLMLCSASPATLHRFAMALDCSKRARTHLEEGIRRNSVKERLPMKTTRCRTDACVDRAVRIWSETPGSYDRCCSLLLTGPLSPSQPRHVQGSIDSLHRTAVMYSQFKGQIGRASCRERV